MSNKELHSKMEMLHSEELRKDLLLYIDFLLSKQKLKSKKQIPIFGSAKGTFKMAADFNDTLEDFNEYMP